MLSFAIIFFMPCSFSSIVLSFCICFSLSVAEMICIFLKLALRKAFITSTVVSLSCLSFRISVSFILFYFLMHSWIFYEFLYFTSTSVLFSFSCSCFLRSLIATYSCFCSLSLFKDVVCFMWVFFKYSFLCSSFTFVMKPSTTYPTFYSCFNRSIA